MKYLNKYQFLIIGTLLTLFAAIFRFYEVDHGFTFTDEGYFFYPGKSIYEAMKGDGTASLAWYHALMFWVSLGGIIFGFTFKGALIWAAISGVISVILFYFFSCLIFTRRITYIATFLFATNYYIIFYQRTALAVGYAISFLSLFLVLFVLLLQVFKITPRADGFLYYKLLEKYRYVFLIIVGVVFGMLFHIRIDTGIVAFGMLGAMGLTVMVKEWKKWRTNINKAWWYISPFVVILCIGVTIFVLFFEALSFFKLIDWNATKSFYNGHLILVDKGEKIWRPFLFIHFWKLIGKPFLFIGGLGLVLDVIWIRKLAIYRLWILICFLGLSILLLRSSIAYPRAYVYLVMLLCFYFAFGVEYFLKIEIFKNKKMAFALILIVLVFTFVNEFILFYPLFNKRANYDKTFDYIKKRGAGSLHGTHSWPIFALLPFEHKNYIVYQTYNRHKTYQDFCVALKQGYEEQGARYMILDNNIAYFGGDFKMLQQFVVTNLPDRVYVNDYGEDYHVCMDAFGRTPIHNLFTDKIMVYDMKNFRNIPREPIPYSNDKKMEEIFLYRWNEKYKKNTAFKTHNP